MRNIKNGESASSEISQLAPDSAAIIDFLYVDRDRISSLYAQLFPQGVLSSVKTNSQFVTSDDKNIGSDVKIFKAESKSTETETSGLERVFDASWSVPLDVLAELQSRSLIKKLGSDATLGSVVLAKGAFMRIVDLGGLEGMIEPSGQLFLMQNPDHALAGIFNEAVKTVKAIPKIIQAHFLTSDARLWASLKPTGLTVPTGDLVLKYGGDAVSGQWDVLYVIDAWPAAPTTPVHSWSGGAVIDGYLELMHALRVGFGRQADWYGITPLMIYRKLSTGG